MNNRAAALVVGGTGAVGSQICTQLLARDLTVFGTSRSSQESEDIRWIRWSVGQPFPSDEALQGSTLRAVFYCVGVPSSKRSLLDTQQDELVRLYEINACGLIGVLARLTNTIRRSGTSIIALSSDATTSTRALNGPYTASKLALEAFTRTIAIEEQGHGVRANIVCPSLIESQMGDLSLRRKGITDVAAYKSGLPGGKALSPHDVAISAISVALDPHWAACSGQVFRIGAPPR